jgi:long-chain fatty acid transport protein
MGKHRIRILGTTTLVALVVGTTQALAGGLAIREQSAWGEGASYAGVAAGGSVSAMFWNPATMTQTGKFALENSAALIFPQSSQTGTNNVSALLGLPPAFQGLSLNDGTPNSGQAAFAPSAYATFKLNDRLWAGVSVNSPFGLSVAFQNPNWAGAFYGESSTLRTYNVAPSVAYKLADWISVGVGFQAQYAQVNLMNATGIVPPALPATAASVNLGQLTGDGWGFGWTAGVTVTPTPWTQIGLGYRSAVNQSIGGSFSTNGVGGTPGPVSTTIKLPDSASLGVRQGLTTQLAILGTVEWTGWKRIGTSIISQPNGQAALAPSGTPVTVPFQWNDGWFYSIGLEYVATPAWTFRGGVGFEKSPITDQVRIPLLPDNDRTWFSVGATNKVTNIISVDLAYSFVDVKNTPINVGPGNPSFNGLVTYTGTSRANVSILSLGVKFKLDEPPPAVATRG